MRALFAVTLFCSASLLFLVQPMVGKMVLPYLGGSPAVWNTCVVFFQAVLLLGYLYAHRLTSLPGTKRQLAVHLPVLAAGAVALFLGWLLTPDHAAVPVLPSLAPTGDSLPAGNVLALLTVAVGLPFFALSASAPLLQKWFAATGHPSAKDPYFLYAASNAGSLLFLLGYPLVVEPTLRVVEQTWLFAGGFVLLVALTAVCGRATLRPLRPPSLMADPGPAAAAPPPPSGRDKARWLLLAFVPSSLMLGVTTHLSTDIVAAPLLWVLPLALYLLTFVVAFTRGADRLRGLLNSTAPVVILMLVFVISSDLALPLGLLVLAHTAAFFAIALTLHTELAAARPHPAHLTAFYLWVSVGGVIGGAVNGLLAPLLFPLPFEYGGAVVLACLLLRRDDPDRPTPPPPVPDPNAGTRRVVDALVPFTMVILCMSLRVLMNTKFAPAAGESKDVGTWVGDWLTGFFHFSGLPWVVDGRVVGILLTFGPPCLLALACVGRPLRFTLAVSAILFVYYVVQLQNPAVRQIARTYFGVLRVQEDANRQVPGLDKKVKFRVLSHGTTLHGSQFPYDAELEKAYPGMSQAPLMYYHRTGPVGDLFLDTNRRHAADARVGVVGLGVGTTAAYVGAGQGVTFYEIDPKVVELADGPNAHFTYLSDARERGAAVNAVLGDARLTLARHDGPAYHLLVIDAFSSDAIPLHLITVEAMRLYADRITADGLIGVHISNRFVDLAPVVAALARECGLACRLRTEKCEDEHLKTLPDTPPGKTSSSWMVLGRSEEALAAFDRPREPFNWERVQVPDGLRVWTDDYADVLAVMKAPEVKWVRRLFGQPSFAR